MSRRSRSSQPATAESPGERAASLTTRRASRRRSSRGEPRPQRVISGGQTGVDRAALDAALEAEILIGGWCPCGRRAEDGRIPDRYPLHETPTVAYAERTRWNVRDADATLIITAGPATGGTALTLRTAREMGRAVEVVDLDRVDSVADEAERLRDWLESTGILVLNVAGPRESTAPGIYLRALELLRLRLRRKS